jgi:hypothetical protein
LQEAHDRVAEMVAELLVLLPGLDFQSILDMSWDDIKFWHKKGLTVFKRMRGIS